MKKIVIDSLEFKRIILDIEGEIIGIDTENLKAYFKNSVTSETIFPQHFDIKNNKFKLTINVLSANNDYPIKSGEWYLTFEDNQNKAYTAGVTEDLKAKIEKSYTKLVTKYSVCFEKDTDNYFKAYSKLDMDNFDYYLKVLYRVPNLPKPLHKVIKSKFKAWLSRFRKKIFIGAFNFFNKTVKKTGNKILFTSDSRACIGGNQKFVYDRMVERGVDKQFKFRFSYKDSIKSYRPFFNKIMFTYYLATSDIIILDDYQPEIYVVDYDPKVKIIQLWHACGAFKTLGLERISKPGAPAFDTRVHKCYTYMTVSSDHSVLHHAEAFGISESKIVPVGIARTDIFFDKAYKKDAIDRMYTVFPEAKKANQVILYAPTFRGENAKNASFPMQMLDFDALGKYLTKTNNVMIIKMHPFVKTPLDIPEEYKHCIIDASEIREVNDILFITDLLITDYSSVIYEFSLFNKPMLFYAFDWMKYEGDRGFYEPYVKTVPGKIVRTFDQLIEALEKQDYDFDKMKDFVKKNFKYTDGKSTDRIIDQLILGEYKEDNNES